jgi:hypothetical protein
MGIRYHYVSVELKKSQVSLTQIADASDGYALLELKQSEKTNKKVSISLLIYLCNVLLNPLLFHNSDLK